MLPGAKETFSTVREIFDSVYWETLFRMCSNHKIPVYCPVDNKMENLMLGLGQHSSTFPSARCLWSKNIEKSQPEVERTISGVIEDAKKREKGFPAAQCNSVETRPVQFLIDHPSNIVRDIFPPAQLHNVILSVNLLIGYLLRLDEETTLRWVRAT